ncbi:MAG: hypothetical protein QOF13_2052 [Solirubrobacterales bacterium]|nr:hypothetical protein [Solirubrobacterales bacterium]
MKASERWETCWKQVEDHLGRARVLAQVVVDVAAHAQVLGIADLLRRYQPGAERAVRVEGLSDRHRLRAPLPVADAEVVGAGVAGDHLVGALDRHVAAALADHQRQLCLVVEQRRDLRHVHLGPRPSHAGHLLVEEDRHLGRLHPHLGDVIGVVERDRQVLAGRGWGQELDIGERKAGGTAGELLEAGPADRVKGQGGFGWDVPAGEVDDLVTIDES